jgi:magnesium-transporting ATPase (P-type)
MKQQKQPESKPRWHALSSEQVLQHLGTTREGLLTSEVERRTAAGQVNRLVGVIRKSLAQRLLHHLKGPVSLLLLGVGAAATLLGHLLDGTVLLGVVAINAIVGVVHEKKADRSMDAIRGLCVSPVHVWRDGERVQVPGDQIVLGDLLELSSGQRVPADCRLVESVHLSIDESGLTGESVPASKDTAAVDEETSIADQSGMVFAGTMVCAGQGRGVVVAVGEHTVMGSVGATIDQMDEISTPLLNQLDRLAKWLTIVILLAALGTFSYGLWRGELSSSEVFLASVAFAAAAIPEGLSAALTIALGIGVRRMAHHRAIVRRLPVVEALGSVTVICSDKTGTLTTNEMTVEELVTSQGAFQATGHGWNPEGTFQGPESQESRAALELCCQGALLCNDAHLHRAEDGQWHPSGDPTEAALVVAASKAHVDGAIREKLPRQGTVPFRHEHPYMATLHEDQGSQVIWVKGSPEVVLGRCAFDTQGPGRDFWDGEIARLAKRGLRIVVVARKILPAGSIPPEELERHCQALQAVGVIAMADPPHDSVPAAIQACQRAGIRLKMITGDHLATAQSIGERIGLLKPGEPAKTITGAEWKKAPRSRWRELARVTQIFARTEPSQKLEIVKALQEAGEVVAMTGDGLNDAPALKRAEVGIACGANSADAAKEAASIVLTKGRFEAIAQAVAEGRTIYENIQKVVLFLLSSGASEAILAASAIFTGGLLPLLPIQILWINLVSTVILGLALAFGTSHPGVMERDPRHPSEPLIPHDLKLRLAWAALLGATFPLLFFDWAMDHGRTVAEARSIAMTVLLWGEVALMMSLRHLRHTAWEAPPGTQQGGLTWGAAALVMGMQIALMYVPSLQGIFQTAAISANDWFAILACWGCQILSFEWLKGWSDLLPHTSTSTSLLDQQIAPSPADDEAA